MIIKKSFVYVWLFIILMILLFLVSAYFIKVPNIIKGEGILVKNNIFESIADREGVISYIAKDGENLKKDQIILEYKNNADLNSVSELAANLKGMKKINHEYFIYLNNRLDKLNINKLGEIKISYIEFYLQLKSYIYSYNNNPYIHDINNFNSKISFKKENFFTNQKLLGNYQKKVDISKSSFNNDSLLFKMKLITLDEFNSSKLAYIQAKTNLQSLTKEIHSEVNGEKNLEFEKKKTESIISRDIELSFNTLVEKYINLIQVIEKWEEQYIVRAPFDGKIQYYKFWKINDYIYKNDKLFTVLSDDKSDEIEIKINIEGAGKIKANQKCLVELKEFPAKDFGLLEGKVKKIISLKHLEKENVYSTFIRVLITKNKITNYGHLLNTNYSMPVRSEIIIENERLINKIFKRLRTNVEV